jgi:RNA polymerase sigma-70 factor (ECF subfamily)
MSDAPETPGPTKEGTSLTLLQRLRANEPDAWQTMVRLYTPLVWHWCGRSGVRGADADDVAQEVFAAAAASLADFRRDRPGDTFRGWLRGITRNRLLLHFRRDGRQPRAEGGADALERLREAPDPASAEDEEAEAGLLFRRAVELIRSEFEQRTWEAFWATVIESRPTDLVAGALGVTPAAVRKARSRVLHRLREHLGDLIE